MKTKKASKTNTSRFIFFNIAITYNLILGFYLRGFLVLSPTLQVFYLLSALPTWFLTVKINSKAMRSTVYTSLILIACMNIAYAIYCRRVFPILAIISLGIVFMYFVAFANATHKDKLLTKIYILIVSALIVVLLFSAYIFVYKQEDISLTNGQATLWDTSTVELADEICGNCGITKINSEPVYYLDLESKLSFGTLNVVSPKGNNFSAYVINPGENYQGKMKDCLVTQVDSFFYQNGSDFEIYGAPLASEIKYFKKITMNSSLDDIINELGYPSLIDYSTAEYKGEITISTLQMRYNFSNKEYDGHTFITIETFKNEVGAKENRILSIAYSIEFPT